MTVLFWSWHSFRDPADSRIVQPLPEMPHFEAFHRLQTVRILLAVFLLAHLLCIYASQVMHPSPSAKEVWVEALVSKLLIVGLRLWTAIP